MQIKEKQWDDKYSVNKRLRISGERLQTRPEINITDIPMLLLTGEI